MDFTGVDAARTQLRTAVAQERNLEQIRDSLETHRQMMTHAERLSANAIEMLRAFQANQFQRVHQLRPEQSRLLQEAARELGAREVFAHVRAAWRLQRIRDTTGRLSEVLAMHRVMQARGIAAQTLARQMRLTQLSNMASHGALPRTAPTPARTRAGAGFMVAIEAMRIIAELAEAYRVASEAEASREHNRIARGQNMVRWWQQRGVSPTLALLDGDDNPVAMSQGDIWRALGGEEVENLPENARVVVTEVSRQDRLAAVAQLAIASEDMNDWHRHVEDDRYERHASGWQPFVQHNGQWCTLVYEPSARAYQASFDAQVHQRLTSMHRRLRASTEEQLSELGGDRSTLADTAWFFGVDRLAHVYDQGGRLTQINFGGQQPVFVGRSAAGRGMVQVRAANAATYEVLRRYWWNTGEMVGISEHGYSTRVVPNTHGLCLVNESNLRPADGGGDGGDGGGGSSGGGG